MEWTEADMLPSARSERRVLGGDLYDIGNLPYVVDNFHILG